MAQVTAVDTELPVVSVAEIVAVHRREVEHPVAEAQFIGETDVGEVVVRPVHCRRDIGVGETCCTETTFEVSEEMALGDSVLTVDDAVSDGLVVRHRELVVRKHVEVVVVPEEVGDKLLITIVALMPLDTLGVDCCHHNEGGDECENFFHFV